MKKKRSRRIAAIMLAAAVAFLIYALSHPETSWPWGNGISYILYGTYVVIMAVLFVSSLACLRKGAKILLALLIAAVIFCIAGVLAYPYFAGPEYLYFRF